MTCLGLIHCVLVATLQLTVCPCLFLLNVQLRDKICCMEDLPSFPWIILCLVPFLRYLLFSFLPQWPGPLSSIYGMGGAVAEYYCCSLSSIFSMRLYTFCSSFSFQFSHLAGFWPCGQRQLQILFREYQSVIYPAFIATHWFGHCGILQNSQIVL